MHFSFLIIYLDADVKKMRKPMGETFTLEEIEQVNFQNIVSSVLFIR